MQRLLAAYAEPQRHYHTGQHLSECLGLLDQHLALANEPGEVELALWFHDAIYDVRANDNELKSAEWAVRELQQAGVASERIQRVQELILATRHSARPEEPDQALLVDVDLSILGAPRARFEEYEHQVRAEYAWVPEPLFRQKRRAVLSEFLSRRPIYNTQQLLSALENQARANLSWSLQQLEN